MKDLLELIKKLNLDESIKLLNQHYTERYTLSGYYNAYHYVCDKYDIREPLLPLREYRNA